MSGLIVAGMHRSGTSLTTAFLTKGGYHPGDVLLTSPTENYFEDKTFVGLHRKWLGSMVPEGNGHHDWGISDGGSVPREPDGELWNEMSQQAADFFATRANGPRRWSAKDPRASLFLPLWAANTTAKFVLVYRNPWDVVDSAVRLGEPKFCSRPRLVRDAWYDYNSRLLEFAVQHHARCFVLAAENLVRKPEAVWAALQAFAEVQGPVPYDVVDMAKFVLRDSSTSISRIYDDLYPAHSKLLRDLDQVAAVTRQLSSIEVQKAGRPRHAGQLSPGTGVQVVIPCRNDGDFLAEAIASVDEHGGDRVELTIVDDGSTEPETLRILGLLRESGRDVVVTPGVGLSAARNAGISASQTCAVLPLDADNRLRRVLLDSVELIENGSADVVHGKWQRFGTDSTLVEPPLMTADNLIWTNTVDACALIRRSLLENLSGWDPSLPFWEDWDLWLGAVEQGAKVTRLDEVTFDYLVRADSLNAGALDDVERHFAAVRHITSKHETLLGSRAAQLVDQAHTIASALHHQRKDCHRLEEALGIANENLRQLNEKLLQVELAIDRKGAELMLRETTWAARVDELLQDNHQLRATSEKLEADIERMSVDFRERELRLSASLENRQKRILHLRAELEAVRSRRVLQLVDRVAETWRRRVR